ncbi:hypothetical protein [Amycolatopsis marina]|uniref:hypothetical protein n=1 Tax=Amycolatopsis marina TaxID=490629 RepID=UPI000B83022E|nr:hypothetical protein [Amycolatopsis marina]
MRRRHAKSVVPDSSTPGHVMLGGVVDDERRWIHWVPVGAEPVRHRLGIAYRAVCGAACVPATADYLAVLQACPECDERERGFSHRTRAACCAEDMRGSVR